MNFLVLLPVIATVMATSIPLESYSITREPSLIHSFPGSADGRNGNNQNSDSDWIGDSIGSLLSLPLYKKVVKLEIILGIISCIFGNGNCDNDSGRHLEKLTAITDNLASVNLPNFSVRDPLQKTRLDESFTSVENAVNPINQKIPFPLAVPALWNPYVNIPLVADQREMLNVNNPPAGRFIPYFNSMSFLSHPLLMNTVAQHSKALTPAGTVSETTS